MLNSILQDAGGWNAVRRAVWALAIKSLPGIYGLGTLITLIKFLPLEDYGRYGIAIAYINVAAVCSRGLWGVTLIRALPGSDRAGVIGPVSWLTLGTALFAALLSLWILPALQIGWQASLWAAGTIIAFVPRLLAGALAQADSKSAAAFWIDSGYYLGSIIGFVGLALIGELNSAEVVLKILFLASLVSVIVSFLYYTVLLRVRFYGNWRFVGSYGRWTGAQALGEIYLQQGDILLIGALLDPLRLAPYIAARALIRLYNMLSQAANFLVLPVASRLAAEGQFGKLRKKIRSALLAIWMILLPLNALLFWFAEWLLPLILGEKYAGSVPYFRIILGATFFEPIHSILSNALMGIGQARKVAVLVWSGLLVNIVANLVLVARFDMRAVPWILVATYALLSVGFLMISWREFSSNISDSND